MSRVMSYRTMSRQDARDYLERFLAETGPRLDALRREVDSTGGPAADALDLSPESLGPLWDWAKPRLSWREGWAPGQRQLHERVTADEVEPPGELPSWFDVGISGWSVLSAETLWLVDAIGRYLGESLLATASGTGWTAGYHRRKNYVYQNHPVVVGLPRSDECQPMWIVSVLVKRELAGEPTSLLDLYQVWTGEIDWRA